MARVLPQGRGQDELSVETIAGGETPSGNRFEGGK